MQGDIKEQDTSEEYLTPASFSHRTEEVLKTKMEIDGDDIDQGK